jgi:hypothetical protein
MFGSNLHKNTDISLKYCLPDAFKQAPAGKDMGPVNSYGQYLAACPGWCPHQPATILNAPCNSLIGFIYLC